MNHFIHVLFLLGFISFSKAHFVKIVVLAGLGLAGLWMVHTLAQDYNRIQNSGGGGGGGTRLLEKRSTDSRQSSEINWEFVLSRDPARCARSFICQLTAVDEGQLDEIGKNILKMTRATVQKDSWASKQLLEALKYGENVVNPGQCMKMYKLCPYSSQTMTSLLRIFGS